MYLNKILSILAVLIATVKFCCGQLPNTFEVSSRIRILKNYKDQIVSVKEKYSREQSRAKLEYESSKLASDSTMKKSAQFIYDARSERVVVYPNDKFECKVVDKQSIMDEIYGKELDLIKELTVGVEKHIIGPTAVLIAIHSMKDKLKLEQSVLKVIDRGVLVLLYTMDYKLKSGGTIRIEAMYPKVTAGSDNYPTGVTLCIDDLQLVISYAQIKAGRTLLESATTLDESILIDEFSISPLTGCSELLDEESESVFTATPENRKRFSFEAKHTITRLGVINHLNYYVAYDYQLDSMRFDLVAEFTESHVRHQVFNFKLNRMYSVAKLMKDQPKTTNVGYYLAISRQQETSDAMTKDTQCIVTRLFPKDRTGGSVERYSIGRLLAGADRFVHLGLASVRGIRARMYEAHDANWPFWVEQSLPYYTTDGKHLLREPNKGANNELSKFKVTVLLYFEDTGDQTNPNGPPLAIQISTVSTFQSINLYIFAWDIEETSPAGFKAVEMFSLAEHCSQGIGGNQYARTNLLLEEGYASENDIQGSDLSNRYQRDLAVLAGLQEDLDLPATMVYDLRTEFGATSDLDEKLKQKLYVDFRLAEHADNLVEFSYLGQGSPEGQYRHCQLIKYRRSFQSCAISAAHMRLTTYFGYNPWNYKCVTEYLKSDSEGNTDRKFFFKLDPNEEMEVYRIDHIKATKEETWLGARFHKSGITPFLNSRIRVAGSRAERVFLVQQVHVDTNDYKNVMTKDSFSIDDNISSEEIRGFGLVANKEYTSHVSPVSSSADLWTDETTGSISPKMNYATCRLACLRDPDCKMFSLCSTPDLEYECLTTNLKLTSAYELAQFTSLSNGKPSGVFDLKLASSERIIQVRKDHRCDMYRKQYIELFQKQRRQKIKAQDYQFQLVNSAEHCALTCMNQNFDLLKDMDKNRQEYPSSQSNDRRMKEEDLKKLEVRDRSLIERYCTGFKYISGYKLAQLKKSIVDIIKERTVSKPAANQGTGYCVIEQGPIKETLKQGKDKSMFKIRTYRLRFEMFYEKQYGIKLEQSELDSVNNQTLIRGDIETCARSCYLQLFGPEPMCRSFSVELRNSLVGDQIWCFLNSATLKDITEKQKYDLVDDAHVEMKQKWHFEPRPGYIMNEPSLISEALKIDRKLSSQLSQFKEVSSRFRLGTFSTLFIVVIGIATGILIGLKHGEKVTDRFRRPTPRTGPHIDTQTLVLDTTVEQTDSPNFNGTDLN